MNILQKPYHMLAITSLIAALISLLPLGWRAGINLADTYIVVEYSMLLRLWAAILLVFWGINFAGSSLLQSVPLNRIHTAALLLAFFSAHLLLIDQEPAMYSHYSYWEIKWYYFKIVLPFWVTIIALLTGLAAILLNFVVSWQSLVRNR